MGRRGQAGGGQTEENSGRRRKTGPVSRGELKDTTPEMKDRPLQSAGSEPVWDIIERQPPPPSSIRLPV